MSLPKMSAPAAVSRRAAIAVLIGGCSTVLAGCGFRPTYANRGPGESSTRSELRAVHITPPIDRVEQEVRNHLLFAFGQTTETPAAAAAYTLSLRTSSSVADSIVSRGGLTRAQTLFLEVSYTLTEPGTEEPLVNGRATSQAAFDIFDQQFANLRARMDAENRTAKEVAEQIHNQVAAYFATKRVG